MLFNRWNRSLRSGEEAASLPAALRPTFLQGDSALRIVHPGLPDFSALLEPTPGGFVLRLLEKRPSEQIAELSAQALATLRKLTAS